MNTVLDVIWIITTRIFLFGGFGYVIGVLHHTGETKAFYVMIICVVVVVVVNSMTTVYTSINTRESR